MEEDRFINILKQALEMEEEGYDFYVKTSGETTNPLGKAAFKSLAEDELDHIKVIKEFYSHLCGGKACPDIDKLAKAHSAADIKRAVRETVNNYKGKIDVTSDDIKAYGFAMDLENNSLHLYKDTLRKIKGDEESEKLLNFLINEESEHFNLLQSTSEYLSNPADWFLKEERPIVEGG